MKPENFPLLRAAAPNQNRFDAVITAIDDALKSGAIRNARLSEAKSILSRVLEKAWQSHVWPYFHRRDEGMPTEEARAIYDAMPFMSSLHDVLLAHRKLIKTAVEGEGVSAMRRIVDEVLPLAEAAAELKGKVMKGRAPAPPKPENPNKVVMTCPCCFRGIAVQRGAMAHHGYRRPVPGWQTASCPGVQFKPLEVSSAGLEWLIERLKSQLKQTEEAYRERDKKCELIAPGSPRVTVHKGDDRWAHLYARYVVGLEGDIRGLQREIPPLEERLRAWTPTATLPGHDKQQEYIDQEDSPSP